ncbi:MAG: cellulase family glycosylhydrolase [Roseiflexaceae bacterium]|nr:cellulase family glycosylhydrolase [Roseiflexaceae bacterium]
MNALPAAAHQQAAASSAGQRLFLPMVGTVPGPNPFGIDFSIYSGEEELQYGVDARPKWARAGDVVWSQIEAERGSYDWAQLDLVDANIRRLRAAGVEPMLIIQQTPVWAQSVPGRLCSPPKPEYLDDMARFIESLVTRYSSNELYVKYWEFWNEPDFSPANVQDSMGIGCWGDMRKPDNGGQYYGEALKRAYAAVKAANPSALVFGGALSSFGVNDPRNDNFVRGMLTTAPNAFDAFSFHAYGEYGYGDLLRGKTLSYRRILDEFGLQKRPMIATEVAATCVSSDVSGCKPDYATWVSRQANYAARIYAVANALDLMGAFWYTFSSENPGYRFSHLLERQDGKIVPRPAYYAFRNSAQLLAGAQYIGPPLQDATADDKERVQTLIFRKATSTLYVMWVPNIEFSRTITTLKVSPGAKIYCTQKLELPYLNTYDCSDTRKIGVIDVVVNSLPQYVEVFD